MFLSDNLIGNNMWPVDGYQKSPGKEMPYKWLVSPYTIIYNCINNVSCALVKLELIFKNFRNENFSNFGFLTWCSCRNKLFSLNALDVLLFVYFREAFLDNINCRIENTIPCANCQMHCTNNMNPKWSFFILKSVYL